MPDCTALAYPHSKICNANGCQYPGELRRKDRISFTVPEKGTFLSLLAEEMMPKKKETPKAYKFG